MSAPLTTMFKILSKPYDVITYPFYYMLSPPSREDIHPIQGVQIDPNDPLSPWISLKNYGANLTDGCDNFDQVISKSVKHYGNKKAIGFRKILSKNKTKQPNGRTFLKYNMSPEYSWLSYLEYDEKINQVVKGLINIGVKKGDIVMIFMETRFEWMLTAYACYRLGAVVATLYATLGDDGIIHGINETETKFVVTSNELLSKISKIRAHLTHLQNIIYIQDDINGTLEEPEVSSIENINLISFHKLTNDNIKNNNLDINLEEIKPSDPCVLMYTSGSTGKPKAIILSHSNMVNGVRNVSLLVGDMEFTDEATFIAFLPAAHIMECLSEPLMMTLGIGIGYSSTFTLMNGAPGLAANCKSDLEVLKPEVMIAVPLMLDRMRKVIETKILGRGKLVESFFNFALEYKGSWNHAGHKTPLIDKFISEKAKKLFGGKIKMLLCGGAPLSADTQAFIRNCLGINVTQGYASTETGGSGCFASRGCWKVGTCGPPLPNVQVKLIPWEEGNYLPTDKPHARGEIVIGSKAVSDSGYYNNEEATKESFYTDENGLRWFKTGDIGEAMDDGTFKIIDRKKDLVKLQHGEYISLGKVESILKGCSVVANICVCGDSFHTYIIALITPDPVVINMIARNLNIPEETPMKDLCNNEKIISEILKEIQDHGKKSKLHKTEIPEKIKLCPETWTPDTGLVTAALKIRRKQITDFYSADIKQLYS